MDCSHVDETYQESPAQSKDHNLDSDNPDEHMDHTYSAACDIVACDIPYSALSPDTVTLKRKIRRLHRRAQRQKHKIKCMKQLIKQLRASCDI